MLSELLFVWVGLWVSGFGLGLVCLVVILLVVRVWMGIGVVRCWFGVGGIVWLGVIRFTVIGNRYYLCWWVCFC